MFGLTDPQAKLYLQQWTGQLSEYITALSWSIQGHLAACSAAGEVLFGRPSTQSPPLILTPTLTPEQSIDCLQFSADGQFLAAGGQDGQIRIWQMGQQLNLMATVEGGGEWIDHLCWHPYHQHLAFGLGRYVQIWDALSREIIVTLPFTSSSVLDLAWHPQGQKLAIAGNGGLKIWDAQDWDGDPLFLEMPAACPAIAWSPNGEYLAASCLDQTLWVWPVDNGEPWRMTGFGGKVRHLAWSKVKAGIAPLLAVSSSDEIIVWKKALEDRDGWLSWVLSLHNSQICDLQFHPSSLLLASVAEDGMLLLWQKAKQLVQRLIGVRSGFSRVAWQRGGEQLAAGGQDGEVLVWTKSSRGKGFG